MIEEFEVSETNAIFDVKKFLFRALSYWKLFVVLLVIGVVYVYQTNLREEFSYRLGTKISIEDDTNPLFTSTQSLNFNWGGVTSKVQTMIVMVKSRSHHEKVVERLEFYKSYLKQGRFRKQDIYKEAPFRFNHAYNFPQLINIPIEIVFLDANSFEIHIEFLESTATVQNYLTKGLSKVDVPVGLFKRRYQFEEPIELPFLKGVVSLTDVGAPLPKDAYFFQFSGFNEVVASYQSRTSVTNTGNSPILDISLIDKNTEKIVDYLNTIVSVLRDDQLNRKNQYASNTINFIDEQISRVRNELTDNAQALNDYRKESKLYNLTDDNATLNEKLSKLDAEKETIERQLNYFSSLK